MEEFNSWKKRGLSNLEVVYVILDGTRLGVRGGTKEKEAVLVAWAFLEDGSRELLSVSLGNQESSSAWKGSLDDMVRRGVEEADADSNRWMSWADHLSNGGERTCHYPGRS